MKVMFKFFS